MRLQNPLRSFPASVAILRLAALLVPRQRREEWLEEWRSELWHVWQICHQRADLSLQDERDERQVTAFCLGAFQDARWIRRDDSLSSSRRMVPQGSPTRCVVFLATVGAA